MGGHSGTRVAPHTPLVGIGDNWYAVTEAQFRIITRAIAAGGSTQVIGREVKVARNASSFGGLSCISGPSGERWTYTLKKGVKV